MDLLFEMGQFCQKIRNLFYITPFFPKCMLKICQNLAVCRYDLVYRNSSIEINL
jgi:hypothetical protein